MTSHQKAKQKLINETISLVNKARKEFGLPALELLKGNQGRSTSCPIQKGLGIRCRTDGVSVVVRSKRAAQRLAKAWNTGAVYTLTEETRSSKGFKDYTHEVMLPETLSEFVSEFDTDGLKDFVHQRRTTFIKGDKVNEDSFRSSMKRVNHLICSPDTAKKIVAYI